jgi:hypothetical protein
MPINVSIPILTLEKADTWAFATGLAEFQINVLRIFPNAAHEKLAEYTSGLYQHSRIFEFSVKCFPMLTVKSATHPDTSDYLAFVNFLKGDKAMRVKGITLGRYDTTAAQQIAAARTLLLNRHVTLASFDAADSDGKTYNELSFKLISRFYE